MFRNQREELRLLRLELDRESEQANALRATIELLEDEIRRLEASIPPPTDPTLLRAAIRAYFAEVSRLFFPTGNQLVQERQAILREYERIFGEAL